jgi:hypothetical protein
MEILGLRSEPSSRAGEGGVCSGIDFCMDHLIRPGNMLVIVL